MAGRNLIHRAIQTAAVAVTLGAFAVPALAVTCEEARSLSAGQLAYWGQRLQVPPQKLAALLQQAFCERQSSSVAMTDRPDRRSKSIWR